MSRSDTDHSRSQRSPWWSMVLRGLVLAAALFFLARGVKWHDISIAVRRAGVLVPSVVVAMNACMMGLRALRLRVLLARRLSFRSAFTTLLTSSALNNVTPFRGGHVARLWMLESTAGVTKSAALAVTLVENLLEIAVLALLAFAASCLTSDQGWATVAAPLVFAGTVALLILLWATAGRAARVGVARGTLRGGWRGKLRQFLLRSERGCRALSEPGVPARAALLSLLAWLCEAAMILVCARSMGLALSFPLSVVVLFGINLALALPSTPASTGPFEGATVAVLLFAGIAKGPAVAFAFFYHAIQVVPVTVVGAAALLLSRRRRFCAAERRDTESAPAPPAPAVNVEQF